MTRFVFRDGAWVDAATAPPLHPAHGRGPMLIRDGMDPVACTIDGQLYDSKSAYYRAVKDAGCEIVGNDRAYFDTQPKFEPTPVAPDIKRAIQELESR